VLRTAALFLALLAATQGFARAGGVAPADEYFGPFHESILEVRNRIMRFEREGSSQLARDVRGIDTLEVTIEDWYRHYPRDPWIPDFNSRLIRLYARANASHVGGCLRARRIARAGR
jgi:hypothetical protein